MLTFSLMVFSLMVAMALVFLARHGAFGALRLRPVRTGVPYFAALAFVVLCTIVFAPHMSLFVGPLYLIGSIVGALAVAHVATSSMTVIERLRY